MVFALYMNDLPEAIVPGTTNPVWTEQLEKISFVLLYCTYYSRLQSTKRSYKGTVEYLATDLYSFDDAHKTKDPGKQ